MESYLLDKANIASLKFPEEKPDRTDTTVENDEKVGLSAQTPDNVSQHVTYLTVRGGEIKPDQDHFKWKV